MSQLIPCTNGSLLVNSSRIEVRAPLASAELARGDFLGALKAAEEEYDGGLTSQVCHGEAISEGKEIQMTVHHNDGDPQAGDWAEVSVYEPAATPVHLQIGTFALRELRQEL